MTLNDSERAKEFIQDLIQSVAGRIKGQDSTVLE